MVCINLFMWYFICIDNYTAITCMMMYDSKKAALLLCTVHVSSWHAMLISVSDLHLPELLTYYIYKFVRFIWMHE